MKRLALYGMILLGVTGTLSLTLGIYLLAYPPQMSAGEMPGGLKIVAGPMPNASLMAWSSLSASIVLLGLLALMWKTASPTLVKWNAAIMSVIGVFMLVLMSQMIVYNPLTPFLEALAGLMFASGLVVTVIANPFGRMRVCPECGSRVVNWGKRGLTYCTSCSWFFGAIPASTSVMVSGDPGVGKTMLTLKLAELSMSRGRRCIFLGCDQPPEATKKVVSGIHHSVSRISEAISKQTEDFIVVDAFSSSARLNSDEKYHTTGVFDLNEMSLVVAEVPKAVGQGLTVVVDSVNPLFLHRDAPSVLKFLDHCRAKCIGRGDMFLFSITEGVIEQGLYRKLESMADIVIEMKFAEEHQKRFRRFRLTKIRGQNLTDEWVYFEIIPHEGMVFRPIERQSIPA